MFGRNPLVSTIANAEWSRAKDLIEENGNLVRKWTVVPSLSGGNNASDILALHQACKMPDLTVSFLETLLFGYPESIRKKETGSRRFPLHIALRARLPNEVILYILNKYPEACAKQDSQGRVPLHYAISNYAPLSIIQTLVNTCPASASAADFLGWTPLHVAANTARSVAMVEFLIEASPESVVSYTRKGNTPLMAAKNGNGPDKSLIVILLTEEEKKVEKTAYFQNFREAESNYNWASQKFPHLHSGPSYGVRKMRRSNSFRLVV